MFAIIKSSIGSILPKPIKNAIKKLFRVAFDMKILKQLKETSMEKRFLLLLTPDHANIGDHAIAINEEKFIGTYFPGNLLIEIPIQTWMLYKNRICKYIKKEDTILICGGGFLGTLWIESENEFRSILKLLPQNKIVVFPQTIFFDESIQGREQLELSKEIYRGHKNLSLCVRDRKSYEFVINNKLLKDLSKCYFIPDMVTFYDDFKSDYIREDIVLICMRNDHEKHFSEVTEKQIMQILNKYQLTILYTNTVISHYIKPGNRDVEVNKKMQEFARAKFVITDRLHGMLISAVTGTPCLFMDNCSQKVSGAYEWINNLDYIRPLRHPKQVEDFMEEVVGMENFKYNNEHLKEKFDTLAAIVKG